MANGSTTRKVPYAAPDDVIKLIQHHRRRGLPKPLTRSDVEAMNIPSSSAARALQALKFLNLLDEEGHETEQFDQLKRASDSEYKTLLAEVVRNAYPSVFKILDPAEANADDINAAFRKFDPVSELRRMTNLFMGLCVEAGIASDEKRPKSGAPRSSRPAAQSRRSFERKADDRGNNDGRDERTPPPDEQPRHDSGTGGTPDEYKLMLDLLLRRLPKDQRWTPKQRERWLGAVAANIDMVVEVIEDTEPKVSEQQGVSGNDDASL